MSKQINNSGITTRLFLEGLEVDLNGQIDIANTYSIASVKNISLKNSPYSKTISVPGSAKNSLIFNFLYEIKSTGAPVDIDATVFPASIYNNISGVTINDATISGGTFDLPVTYGIISNSYHNQITNSTWFIDISGQTDVSGYIVCKVNGIIISCNRLAANVGRYYFPTGFYNFNDVLQIILQPNFQAFNGNIKYDLDFRKRMRAYVIEDNQIILQGYAKLIDAKTKNGLVSYDIQITSDLGGFISSLANERLEDLYTVVEPDLSADPTGQTSKTASIPTPFDHEFTINNIQQSWRQFSPMEGIYYPLIDYGNDITVGATNFYTSNFRTALSAKTYFDLIFESAGFTYDSNFLNSQWFSNLIIPYKDGNISIIDLLTVSATSNATSGSSVVPNAATPQANSFYIFNTDISDTFDLYDAASAKYTCPSIGTYVVSTNLTCNFTLTPGAGSAGIQLVNPSFTVFIIYELWHDGGGSPYSTVFSEFLMSQGTMIVGGNPYFVNASTSDNFNVSFIGAPVYIATEGDFIKVRISAVAGNLASAFYPEFSSPSTLLPGTATLNVVNNSFTNIFPTLNVSYSQNLDGQILKFKDFVPKSVKQIDYIDGIFKLFNLYPDLDKNKRNHFNIFTRDEFFANQNTVDWTKKLDLLSDIIIKPIPDLDAQQLLFSYKQDKDWYNKLYDSLYGGFTYGSRRVDTGYEFAKGVKNVTDNLIFSATPLVEYAPSIIPSETSIEILNGENAYPDPNANDISSNIIMASGYVASNGSFSPYENEVSIPVSNNFSGTKFTNAKKGVHIIYWGREYIIDQVYNDYAFRVVSATGTSAKLWRPITQGANSRIDNTYYATNDGFSYITNANVVIPAIYDSSDNNITHKPTKTEMKILYFKKLNAFTQETYNAFYVQLTPIVQNGMYQYQNFGDDSNAHSFIQYPWCGHYDDPTSPKIDLLFEKPIQLFYSLPSGFVYPEKNLFTRHWINTVNEIVDKESKLFTCALNLNSIDISNLDLSNIIFINGTNFRINEIRDYSPDSSLTDVELIRLPKFVQVTDGPIVDAGPDLTVNSPFTSTSFAGSVTFEGSDGENIELIQWTKLSGPSGATDVIADTTSPTSLVTGLTAMGTYVYKLYAIDNYGLSAFDTMQIVVGAHSPCTPTVGATNNGPGSFPSPLVLLTGSASGCGGSTITSYTWAQISGGTVSIVTPNNINTYTSGYTIDGSYTFRLTVVDNFGDTNFADTVVTILPIATAIIHNAIGTAGISSVTGIPGLAFAFGDNLPIVGAGTFNGTHGAVAGNITVSTTGTIPPTPPSTFFATLKINGVIFGSPQAATSGASYTFVGVSASPTDEIRFDLSA